MTALGMLMACSNKVQVWSRAERQTVAEGPEADSVFMMSLLTALTAAAPEPN